MQMVNTNSFRSNQTKRVSTYIIHTITCKSQWIIYLLECILCNIQYVGKSETNFNIRFNNHWKGVRHQKAIPACVQFRKEGHNFIQHAKFTLIEQLTETENVRFQTSIKTWRGLFDIKTRCFVTQSSNLKTWQRTRSSSCFYSSYFTIVRQLERSLQYNEVLLISDIKELFVNHFSFQMRRNSLKNGHDWN